MEPGDRLDKLNETELVAALRLEKRPELVKDEAVLDVIGPGPGLLLVCDFISVEDERSELSILSDIREVDEVEDPFEEVPPTEFEFDMSDGAVGVSSVRAPLLELHLEDTGSDDEMNIDLVEFDGGSDENGETT